MRASNNTTVKPTHEEIAAKAYLLWEKAGCPAGQDTKYWLQAENELLAASQSTTTTSGPLSSIAAAVSWAKPSGKRARAQAH